MTQYIIEKNVFSTTKNKSLLLKILIPVTRKVIDIRYEITPID